MIQFSLRQLEYFVAAAQHGGALYAAQALHVSQPSISQAINNLEALWGVRLFARLHARGLQLTTEGKLHYRQAQIILRQAETLGRGNRIDGSLAVGCFSTLGPMYFPALLRIYRQAYPEVQVSLFEADTETLLSRIERDTLDLALIYDTGLFNRSRLHYLGELPPYVLLPPDHPLASHDLVNIEELDQQPLILINLPHSREYFLSLFNLQDVNPKIIAETGSIEMARSLVANGHGISILVTRPAHDSSYDGKPIACRPLKGLFPPQKIALASSSNYEISSAGQAFIDVAQGYFDASHGHAAFSS